MFGFDIPPNYTAVHRSSCSLNYNSLQRQESKTNTTKSHTPLHYPFHVIKFPRYKYPLSRYSTHSSPSKVYSICILDHSSSPIDTILIILKHSAPHILLTAHVPHPLASFSTLLTTTYPQFWFAGVSEGRTNYR